MASTRLVDALRSFNAGSFNAGSFNAKGWTTFPIELVDKKGVPIEGFVGFAVDRTVLEAQSDIFPVSAGPYFEFGRVIG